jgi:hypothetical protein
MRTLSPRIAIKPLSFSQYSGPRSAPPVDQLVKLRNDKHCVSARFAHFLTPGARCGDAPALKPRPSLTLGEFAAAKLNAGALLVNNCLNFCLKFTRTV